MMFQNGARTIRKSNDGVTRLVLGVAVVFGVVAMMCVTMLSLSNYGDPSPFSDTASMQMAD